MMAAGGTTMTTPVIVHPIDGGFRATSLAYPALTADAKTEPEAITAIRNEIEAKITAGGRIVEVRLFDREFDEANRRLATNGNWDELQAEIDAIRAQVDADDAAWLATQAAVGSP